MKCKKFASKLNNFVVQKLKKKIKINEQTNPTTTTTMPAMPKEKSSILAENNYSELRIKENLIGGGLKKDLIPETAQTATAATTQGKAQAAAVAHNRLSASTKTDNKITTTTTGRGGSTTPTSLSSPSTSSSRTGMTTTTSTTSSSSSNSMLNYPHDKVRTAKDFIFGKSIGEGSFSTVYLAKDIHTGREYAIKVCEKTQIIREKKQDYVKREREVMYQLSTVPGFVNLFCTFQDTKSLYFVMTYAHNGDLLPYINKVDSFDLECARYYAAELTISIENMHKRNVIHRDLKPENILFDEKMHTLIADFGSAKIINPEKEKERMLAAAAAAENSDELDMPRKRTNSFVGTAQYVSPEILTGTYTTKSADLWALGCIIYQMISGLPPFRAHTEYLIFQKILRLDLTFPDGFDPPAKDLVEKLLKIDASQRLGALDPIEGCYTSIRQHPFFAGVDWDNLRAQTPPIYPYLPGNFDDDDDDVLDNYVVPDHLEPGLGEEQLNRLLGTELGMAPYRRKRSVDEPKNILNIPEYERQQRLDVQKAGLWHQFVDDEVILKHGIVNKRKGLFARKRMLLLTTGPRMVYVDPVQMVKKGEIPWSADLRVEVKNFKIFFVHTPNRTYYLEDPAGFALEWCQVIEDVRDRTYGPQT